MKSDEAGRATPAEGSYRFGDYRLDLARRRVLRNDGTPVQITERVFETLLYLVEHAGALITKRELMDAVWGSTVVEENNLAQSVSALRRALGERPDEHRYIVTVPGRGYRFIAPVSRTRCESVADVVKSTPSIDSAGLVAWPRRKWMSIVIAVAAASLLAWLVASRTFFPEREAQIQSIAVLPFRPLVAGESRDPALELGMADTLITQLSASGAVVVRPLSSVRRYTGLDQDPLEAGRALGVDAVLEANIQRAGDALRVTLRLIRVSDGVSLWTDKLDRSSSDVFATQDAIAEQVAGALTLPLTNVQRARLTKRHTENEEAYRLYLLGRYHWGRLTPSEIATAIDYFQQAIQLDDAYALAYAGLAESYRALPITSDVRSGDVLPLGKQAALHALELDPSLDEALATLCFIETWYDWDWSRAEGSCRRALAINPNGADAHRALSILLSSLGRHEQAVIEARRARELDPLSLLTNAIEAHVLLYAGDIDGARARIDATLALSSDFWIARLFLGRVHLQRGAFDDALREFEHARFLSDGNSETISLIGYARAMSGDTDGALKALAELGEHKKYVPPVNVAMVYNGLGDTKQAIAWLERAYDERDVRLTWLRVEPKWNALRKEPGFSALLKRMGLE